MSRSSTFTGSNHKSIVFPSSLLCFVVLLQSSDYSPQQAALMKKQAATLEDIKALTHQVNTPASWSGSKQHFSSRFPLNGLLLHLKTKLRWNHRHRHVGVITVDHGRLRQIHASAAGRVTHADVR